MNGMSVKIVDVDSFENDVINNKNAVLVKFYAPVQTIV